MCPQQILTTVLTHIVVDTFKSTDNAEPHSISFLPQYQHQRKCSFSERQLKKALRDTLNNASSVVKNLIDDGKLANQIARLVAIVVKIELRGDFCLSIFCTICCFKFTLLLNCHTVFGHLNFTAPTKKSNKIVKLNIRT